MTSSWRKGDDRPVVVAIVAYQGVLADETDAFRNVLSLLPRARVFIAGAQPGIVAGPGGAHEVEATFEELDRADVVVVPGGLGSHRHPEIAAWLRRIKPRFVLASSTGSALLAASGLLKGRTAVTHWLAGPLLELHGVTVSKARLEVDEPYITCSGLATAFDAAFVVAEAIGGTTLVRQIRDELKTMADKPPPVEAPAPPRQQQPSPTQRQPRRPRQPPTGVVEVELEERKPSS
jgi:transcriptional regulator GlxA family with amidase domain